MHIAFFSLSSIYSIEKTQIVLLFTKKVTNLVQYLDFRDVFLNKLAVDLFEYLYIYRYTIKLEKNKKQS